MSAPLEKIAVALADHGCVVKRRGRDISAQCPAHEDTKPSLSVSEGEDGLVLVCCHAGCPTGRVVAALGMRMPDLFQNPVTEPWPQTPPAGVLACVTQSKKKRRSFASEAEAQAVWAGQYGPPTNKWFYQDASGSPCVVVLRWDTAEGKVIRPIGFEDGQWVLGLPAAPRPLYCLGDLQRAEMVVVVEGEKTADAACSLGYVATTSVGGARGASQSDWSPLRGKRVVVMPDANDAGEKYLEDVRRLAVGAGAQDVLVVRPCELFADLPDGGDLADVTEGVDDLATIRRVLDVAIAEAPMEEPVEVLSHELVWQPLPLDALPPGLRSYVEESAASIGCDPALVAAPLLAASAGAIGNSCVVELKEGWTEPCVLWQMPVADSSGMKTPAFDAALRFVRKHEAALHSEYRERAREYRAAEARGEEVGPDPPTLNRVLLDDPTVEEAIRLHAENPRGLLLAPEEGVGWFGGMGRYAKGAKEASMAAWLRFYGGRELTSDRIGRGHNRVPRACVSIATCIQPGLLKSALTQQALSSGLIARFQLLLPPKRKKKWTDQTLSPETDRAMEALFSSLFAIPLEQDSNGDPLPTEVHLSEGARSAFRLFVDLNGEESFLLSGHDAAVQGKIEGLAARLALLDHLCLQAEAGECDPSESKISRESMERGIRLATWYGRETRRVVRLLSNDDGGSLKLARIVDWIRDQGGRTTVRAYNRGPGRELDSSNAEAQLDLLVGAGFARWEHQKPGRGGGRPTKYLVLLDVVTQAKTPVESGASGGCVTGAEATSKPNVLDTERDSK